MPRLWCDQGKAHQARGFLAPVYRWFKRGFDQIQERKALPTGLGRVLINPVLQSRLAECPPRSESD
jgi:hypothetical protein